MCALILDAISHLPEVVCLEKHMQIHSRKISSYDAIVTSIFVQEPSSKKSVSKLLSLEF